MIRLPWGLLRDISSRYLADRRVSIVGCVSFEDRSVRLPSILSTASEYAQTIMVRVNPAVGAFPDNSGELSRRMDAHETLLAAVLNYERLEAPLLATEDELINIVDAIL